MLLILWFSSNLFQINYQIKYSTTQFIRYVILPKYHMAKKEKIIRSPEVDHLSYFSDFKPGMCGTISGSHSAHDSCLVFHNSCPNIKMAD